MDYSRNRQHLLCKWASCPEQGHLFPTPEDLAHHVEEDHVNPCSTDDLFICQWEGCKVYNRPSYSFGWLQRHVKQKHTKERPNKCLMNGCNMSFNSVDALQKHMLRHFDNPSSISKKTTREVSGKHSGSDEKASISGSSKTSVKEASGLDKLCTSVTEGSEVVKESDMKLTQQTPGETSPQALQLHRKQLKVRIPRKTLFTSLPPYSKLPLAFNGAHFHSEVMDRRSMSVIRHTTNSLTRHDHSSTTSSPCITLTARVVGKRTGSGSEVELLVRWDPRIIPDEWVYISRYINERVIPFNQLPSSQLSCAMNCFNFDKFNGKRSKRKP